LEEDINRWGSATFDHLLELALSDEASESGVFFTTCHALFQKRLPDPPGWRHIARNWRRMSTDDFQRMGHAGTLGGWAFETLVADQSHYLPWLKHQLQAAGGALLRRQRLSKLQDLTKSGDDYQAVFNCTGEACTLGMQTFHQNHLLKAVISEAVRI
jgi:hypothetical protein